MTSKDKFNKINQIYLLRLEYLYKNTYTKILILKILLLRLKVNLSIYIKYFTNNIINLLTNITQITL